MIRRPVVALLVVAALSFSALGASCADEVSTTTEEERIREDEAHKAAISERRQRNLEGMFNMAEQVEVFGNSNPGAVHGGATKPVTFTLERVTQISYIQTYHWDSGVRPGTIALKGPDGTVYGPWQAKGVEGQGGMPNAYWEVEPGEILQPGTYTVIDSDPGTWSTNDEMGLAGQTIVRGYLGE